MTSIIVKETAKRILDARKASGLSAVEVAKAAKLTRATYYRYESGDQKNMKLDVIQRIAEAVGAYPVDLVVWEDEKPDPFDGAELSAGTKRFFHPAINPSGNHIFRILLDGWLKFHIPGTTYNLFFYALALCGI